MFVWHCEQGALAVRCDAHVMHLQGPQRMFPLSRRLLAWHWLRPGGLGLGRALAAVLWGQEQDSRFSGWRLVVVRQVRVSLLLLGPTETRR